MDITLKKDSWLNSLAIIADKTLCSHRTALQLASAAVSSSEGAQELRISLSTIWRKRQKIRSQVASVVYQSLAQEVEEGHKFILHWDEKMLKGRRHVDGSHEYMAVVLTNVMTGTVHILPTLRFYIEQIISDLNNIHYVNHVI